MFIVFIDVDITAHAHFHKLLSSSAAVVLVAVVVQPFVELLKGTTVVRQVETIRMIMSEHWPTIKEAQLLGHAVVSSFYYGGVQVLYR